MSTNFPSHRSEAFRFLDPRDLSIRANPAAANHTALQSAKTEAQKNAKNCVKLIHKSWNLYLTQNQPGQYKVGVTGPNGETALPVGLTVKLNSVSATQSFLLDEAADDFFAAQCADKSKILVTIEVAEGAIIKEPICWMKSELDTHSNEPSESWQHFKWIISKAAQVTLCHNGATQIENQMSHSSFSASLIELDVKPSASVSFVGLIGNERAADSIYRLAVSALDNSNVGITWVEVGGRKTQSLVWANAAGKGSSINIRAAVYASQSEVHDFQTHLFHRIPETKSELKLWTVLKDESRAAFRGVINITKEAIQTEAYQQTRGLLLSAQAFAENQPNLEIATDEVKCAHGAAIGPISEDQLYYLQSRGIPKVVAEQLIVDGFSKPVLEKIDSPVLRQRVAEVLGVREVNARGESPNELENGEFENDGFESNEMEWIK